MTCRPAAVVAIMAILSSALPYRASAQQPAEGLVGWVGLFNDDLVTWLENENRLDELCSGFPPETGPWYSCRKETLSPKALVVRLREAPSRQALTAGDLVVVAVPGKGLQSSYVGTQGGIAIPFVPDLVDEDWGYGPYFDETIVERRGSWVRLPEVPFPKDTWLNTADLSSQSRMRWLEPGEIVTSPIGDLYILSVAKGVVRARKEQERDMWCEGASQPPVAPFNEIRLGATDLYTATGHLRLRIKYTRGC